MSPNNNRLLIVEDDLGLQKQLKWCFDGYDICFAQDKKTALAEIRRHEPAVVLQDLGLPPDAEGVSEGLDALQTTLEIAPQTKVVVMTGNDDRENAVKAVAIGAFDFYQKPVDTETLNLIVQRAFRMHQLEAENKRLKQKSDTPLEGVIASSDNMLKICRLIEKVALTDATTLLLGESGTGKEVFSKALHNLSNRAEQKFQAINCAAIPENLLESELFGYEKGAFTGAVKTTPGKFEIADRGTLLLDEIGDMPMTLQAKLLRFLQERTIERIGGRSEIAIDVRVICATHQSLEKMIEEGRFREDLYYRISEIKIVIPPLRDRGADIILLARMLLDRYADKHHKKINGFTEEALFALHHHPWPGNVREMENKINSAVIMADTPYISSDDLGLMNSSDEIMPLNLKDVRAKAEKNAIEQALSLSNGNISQAAEQLGITRPTLYDLMKKLSIQDA